MTRPVPFGIRDARREDVAALAKLHVATFREAHGRLGAPTFELRESQWRDAFERERDWFCYVAEAPDGRLIGFAKGTLHDGGVPGFEGELNKIYVLRAWHRQGIGRQLVEHVARRFLERGVGSMLLFGDARNPSNGFYERLGAERLYSRDGEFDGGYGWRDLHRLVGAASVGMSFETSTADSTNEDEDMRDRLIRSIPLALLVGVSCHSARSPATESIPSGARERVIRGGSLELHALEWPGEGTPLVMLHGLGGNAASWAALVRQLPGRHVIAVDLPGHGASPMASTWDFIPLARDLVTAVRGRWPGSHIWIGHSWGGKLAVATAAADSFTRGLVLVDAVQASPLRVADPVGTVEHLFAGELDAWPSLESALMAVRELPQFSPWTPDVELAFRRAVAVQPDGRVVPLLSREKGAAVMRTFTTDLTEAASKIQAPVFVISAPNSVFERAQHTLFPKADFVSLAGNHWLQISNVSGTSGALLAWLRQKSL